MRWFTIGLGVLSILGSTGNSWAASESVLYWEEHSDDPRPRVTKWKTHTEPSIGISIRLPVGFQIPSTKKRLKDRRKLKINRAETGIRIQNYEDGESGNDEGLMPYEFYLTFLPEIDGDPLAEFKKACGGAPKPLPRIKGGYWCEIEMADDLDSYSSHIAFIPTPRGIQSLDIAAGFDQRDIEAMVKSVVLSPN